MSGEASQSKREGGIDRFHGAVRERRTQRYVPRTAAGSLPSSFRESRCQAEATACKSASAAFGHYTTLPGNLDRFLEATTPSVPAQYLSKACEKSLSFRRRFLFVSFFCIPVIDKVDWFYRK